MPDYRLDNDPYKSFRSSIPGVSNLTGLDRLVGKDKDTDLKCSVGFGGRKFTNTNPNATQDLSGLNKSFTLNKLLGFLRYQTYREVKNESLGAPSSQTDILNRKITVCNNALSILGKIRNLDISTRGTSLIQRIISCISNCFKSNAQFKDREAFIKEFEKGLHKTIETFQASIVKINAEAEGLAETHEGLVDIAKVAGSALAAVGVTYALGVPVLVSLSITAIAGFIGASFAARTGN